MLLGLLIFIPRLLNLDVFLTADEPLFLQQARQFAHGLASGDLSQTLGIGYPGVTVAWWSAPAVSLAQTELGAYVAGRLATAVATALLLLLLYGLSRSLLGRWPAFIAVALLALDPYSLAYGRLLHVAAPLALFMTLTGVAYLHWLYQTGRRWLLLAGFFAGLALLTKSTALLLGPMLLGGLAGWAGLTGLWRNSHWWLRQVVGLLLIGLVAVVTFAALWPAMWIDPGAALDLTFGKLFTDQEAGAGNLGTFWLGQFVEDPGPAFYPVAFLLKATPWLLVGLALSLIFTFNSKFYSTLNTQHSKLSAAFLWLFVITYLVLMTLASKKSIRYMLPAFPVFYLLAGQAFYQLGVLANRRFNRWRWQNERMSNNKSATPRSDYPGHASRSPLLPRFASRFTLHTSRFTLITLLILFTLFYHPYYFTYYNPLLLGWRWAPQTILVGWGEGLDQAARYLNQLPQATVSAWYEWLFSVFYNGQTEPMVPQENLLTADHAVLYINQVQRDIPGPNIIHYFRTRRQPEQTVRLAGIDYAWLYPGPVAAQGVRPDPAPQHPLGGDFGDEVQLLGYNLHGQFQSGQPLIVTLYWHILTVPPGDRFVFVRLLDQAGRLWAKTDSPPVMGLWPVERWQPGMLIEDAQELPILPGTPPGQYRLEVGWYDPASGQPLPASGQPVGQGGGLLLGAVELAWQPSTVAPELPHQTDTRLAPNARLIGYDAPPPAATTGDSLPLRLSWREAKTLSSFLAAPNDGVMFEWRLAGQPVAEQLDPLPWPIDQWGRGATVLSQHDLLVPPTLTSGRYEVTVSLHTGSDPAGDSFSLGWVEVTAPPHQFDLPAGAATPVGPAQLAQNVTLAGYAVDRSDQALALRLYWRAEAPLTSRYKVFAQLLAGDNRVVAQSDSFPAAGQRPTTGWLPGEVISDTHTLPLPPELPPGSYRLIAGLYQPLTGERVLVAAGAGNFLPDAILLTEFRLP